MIKVGMVLGDRYEIIEKIGTAECQMYIGQNVIN